MLPVFTWPEDPARIELGYEGNRCCANSKLQILMGRRKRTKTEEEERGVLKWGIGKLIAHLPVQPVVVPFWHYGMAAVLQQHNKWEGDTFNNRVISWTDMKGGNSVKVWIGERIFFEDLIIAVSLMRLPQHCAFYKPCEGATHHLLTKTFLAQHEEKHGKLHKVDPEPAGDGIEWEAEITKWRTREQDKALYAAITRRVEESLRALQRRADTDIAKRPDENLRVSVQIARAEQSGQCGRGPCATRRDSIPIGVALPCIVANKNGFWQVFCPRSRIAMAHPRSTRPPPSQDESAAAPAKKNE